MEDSQSDLSPSGAKDGRWKDSEQWVHLDLVSNRLLPIGLRWRTQDCVGMSIKEVITSLAAVSHTAHLFSQ